MKKVFITRTQIVESWLPVWCSEQAVFGAFAVASKTDVTIQAKLRQARLFFRSKSSLLRGTDHVAEVLGQDVSQPVSGINKMIAGKEVAIVLQSHGIPACFFEKTEG